MQYICRRTSNLVAVEMSGILLHKALLSPSTDWVYFICLFVLYVAAVALRLRLWAANTKDGGSKSHVGRRDIEITILFYHHCAFEQDA